ncbi:MAG: hypothetical protein LBI67_12705 [Treponema sp.]|nr:hypothetical protein [Treponema sp.]
MTGSCPNEAGSLPFSDGVSFASILDRACGRLEDRRNQGALRRIAKMESTLADLEDELTAILGVLNGAAVPAGAPDASVTPDSGPERQGGLP